MKQVFTTIVAFLLTACVMLPQCAIAQAPEKMSFQAVIRDASNALVTNQVVGMQISILKGSAGGTAVYVETHTPSTNTVGLISIEIGAGTLVSGSFGGIDWADGPYYVKSEIDPVGGTSYNITGISQFLTVPYALYAKTAETISSDIIYSVGDFAHGGIVFWVDKTGKHGLVCAKQDQHNNIRWYAGSYGTTRAKSNGVYGGKSNTKMIIAALIGIGDDGNTYAARICHELQITEGGNTYGDWYLPSIYELNLMYQNKAIIDAAASSNGGVIFSTSNYWSSTEIDGVNAWGQNFAAGFQASVAKHHTGFIRAIRAF